jgi:hypothetical protein
MEPNPVSHDIKQSDSGGCSPASYEKLPARIYILVTPALYANVGNILILQTL